jgi:glucose-6-phosphate 1-dehydrogenase
VPPIYAATPPPANYYRLRLSPEVTIAMGAIIRSAGEPMAREQVELLVSHEPTPQELEPYELLLADAMKGDAFRFARMDYVNEAWRIVDPVLNSEGPLYEYEPGTWGPTEANALVDEHGWHNASLKALGAA